MSSQSPNERQVAGDHYKNSEIQPWDYIHSQGLNFLAGNVVKYVSRYKKKNGIEDLQKALHYLEKLIEVETPQGLSAPLAGEGWHEELERKLRPQTFGTINET